MSRSTITILTFVVGVAWGLPNASAQFSFGYGGGNSGGHGGYKSWSYGGQSGGNFQMHGGNSNRGQGMNWSYGGGNYGGGNFGGNQGGGGFNIQVGPGGIKFGNGPIPNKPFPPKPNCPNGGSMPLPPVPAPTWREPNWQPIPVPPTRRPTPVPPVEAAPAEPQVEVRPNVVPVEPKLPEPEVDPRVNEIALTGRQVTPAEMERAKKFFEERLLELIGRLERRLPKADCDENATLQLMCRHGIPGDAQIQLLDLLRAGDFEAAVKLWLKLLPKCEVPFHHCPTGEGLQRFRWALRQGRPACGELRWLIDRVPAEVMQPGGCCSADDLVAQLEQEAQIRDAIVAAPATPIVNVNLSRESGKAQVYAQPGQETPLPTGVVTLVYHPKLPDGSTVVINSEMVMIGTGGQGTFHMETGYVAQALGHRIQTGGAVPARETTLVRSGILLMNPTGATINFVVDNHAVSLAPDYQQSLNISDTVTVSYDTGGGRRTKRHPAYPGTYCFEVNDGAVGLKRLAFQVEIDNRENSAPFQYIVQGAHAKAEPGQTNTHESDYPIVIRYDRGNGAQTKQILHDRPEGTLVAAVSALDHLWDLFDANAAPTVAPPADPTPIAHQDSNYVPAF